MRIRLLLIQQSYENVYQPSLTYKLTICLSLMELESSTVEILDVQTESIQNNEVTFLL